MRRVARFVIATLVGGCLFLVPFVLVLLVLREARKTTLELVKPLAQWIGREHLLGVVAEDLLALGTGEAPAD